MSEAVLVVDHEGEIRLANRAACELLGMAGPDLRGRALGALFPGTPMGGTVQELFERARAGHGAETLYLKPSGEWKTVGITLSAVPGTADRPDAVMCFVQDLTARKRAQQALARIGQVTTEWKRAQRMAPPPVSGAALELDRAAAHGDRREAGRAQVRWLFYRRVSRALALTLGLPTALLIALDAWAIDRALATPALVGVMALIGLMWSLKLQRHHALLLAAHRDSERYLTGLRRVLVERTKAEEALRQLAFIVESSDDGIVGQTPEGVIFHWNKGAERLFGHSASAVTGQRIDLLTAGRDGEGLRAALERVMV
jgi:PAS domain S-box-containing protein